MLTFFRRIRKGLLGDGATSKYLLYAIGEIALVVIGILIALQINNWNEERNIAAEEIRTIEFIYDELRANRIYHQKRTTELTQELKNAKAILKLTGPHANVVFEDSMFILLHDIHYDPFYSPLIAKFNQLISGNDLNLISNDSLKIVFNEYNSILKLADQLSNMLKASSVKITKYYDKKGMTRDVILTTGGPFAMTVSRGMAQRIEKDLIGIDYSLFDFDVRSVLTDPEFESVISGRLRQVIYNKARIGTVIDQIDVLISFIESHYNIE